MNSSKIRSLFHGCSLQDGILKRHTCDMFFRALNLLSRTQMKTELLVKIGSKQYVLKMTDNLTKQVILEL